MQQLRTRQCSLLNDAWPAGTKGGWHQARYTPGQTPTLNGNLSVPLWLCPPPTEGTAAVLPDMTTSGSPQTGRREGCGRAGATNDRWCRVADHETGWAVKQCWSRGGPVSTSSSLMRATPCPSLSNSAKFGAQENRSDQM